MSPETLVERYRETEGQVIGHGSRLRLNFLAVVARLFGEARARDLENNL